MSTESSLDHLTQTQVTPFQTRILLISVLVIAVCGLVYELIVGTMTSYLFGDSVTHFSIVIGLFLSAMGLGSYLSRWINHSELTAFILVELTIGLVGGTSAALLYTTFALSNYYYLAMVALILIVGACIGLEIPLLTRLVGNWQSLKDTLANVLAFDYVGALLGSILFPLILLPQLGLLQTSFAMGLLNVLVVVMMLWVFRRDLRYPWTLGLLTGVSSLILLGGLAWANDLTTYFERRLYRDEIIYTEQTPYQRIILTRWRDDVRLFLNGNLQFSSQDEYRYHEALIHPAMTLSRSRENVLILGGGDGLVVREVLKYEDVQRVVLVDIDPAMTKLAREHPAILAINQNSLADERVEVVHQDAYKYLEENSDLFGVIIADLPDPNNESLSKLYSYEFFTLAQRHLAVGGVWVSQATSPYFVREAFWSIVNTASTVWPHVEPYRFYVPTFGDWGFFLASNHRLPLADFAPQVPTRILTADLFQTSFIFDSDTAYVETEVNTLNNQNLLSAYERGWRQWR